MAENTAQVSLTFLHAAEASLRDSGDVSLADTARELIEQHTRQEVGIAVTYKHGGDAEWTAVEVSPGWWRIKEWGPTMMQNTSAEEFWKNFEEVLPADVFEVPYTLNDSVESIALVTIVGDEATGHDKYVQDYPVKLFKTDHGWDARKPEAAPVASQEQVDSHAEKQQVSYADAWRYFEREGYDMSEVLGQYA